jgi:cytochrome c-type biogenesis protein CcmH
MNALFFVCAFAMLLVAMAFASTPLFRGAKAASHGFAQLPLLAVLAAMLLAIGLYAAIGRPDFAKARTQIHQSSGPTVRASTNSNAGQAASVGTLLTGLEQRLQENPEDAKGWLLLAKSYDHLGRSRDAAAAYEKAVELGISDSTLEARLR